MRSITPFDPSTTCLTSAGTGNEVKTISVCAPTSLGELDHTSLFGQKWLCHGTGEIVHDELMPGLLQIGPHAAIYHAETDKSDAHVCPLPPGRKTCRPSFAAPSTGGSAGAQSAPRPAAAQSSGLSGRASVGRRTHLGTPLEWL
jgi:hypothetical protein